MFILSKEIIKDIVKYGKEWQESIEKEDLFLALTNFLVAPIFILFIISFFILDIIFSPLEFIIYLKVKKVRNKRNAEEFQPIYRLNKKGISCQAYKYNEKLKEYECISERSK